MKNINKKKRNRSRNRLNLQQKLLILEDSTKNNMKNKDISKKYQLHHATVTKILASKDKILQQAESVKNNCGDLLKVKRYSQILDKVFEKSVHCWFVQKRSLGQPVPSSLLRFEAKKFHKRLYGLSKFLASDGWLQKFKLRHGLRTVTEKGGILFANPNDAEAFRTSLNQFILEQGYDLDNICNADETALYWKLLPNKTLAAKFEKEVHGRKIPKDRVTLHVAANATGTHKIPLMMIGKAKVPLCFRSVGLENLPLIYKSQNKGWMNRNIFIDWYKAVFLPSVKERKPDSNARFILILDNAPSHPSAEELNAIDPQCFVMFLPPNVTSIIQPMDQGVISALKRKYKMSFLRELDAQDLQTSMGLVEFTKKWTLLNCSYLLSSSWNEVSQSTMKNAWNKLLQAKPTANLESVSIAATVHIISRLPGCNLMTLEEANKYMDEDNEFPCWKPLNFDKIVKIASGQPFEYHDEEESESIDEDETMYEEHEETVSLKSLLDYTLILRDWAYKNPEISSRECFTLDIIENRLTDLRNEANQP